MVTKPDLVAPGAQVYSCIPPEKRPDGTYEYTYMAGTSTQGKNKPQKDKISDEFKARLDGVAPHQKVRAIVLLHTKRAKRKLGRRLSRVERKAAIAAIRKSAEGALVEIDEILGRHNGERLSDVNALGSILIETTAAGIITLAASENVSAILEDQTISFLRQLKNSASNYVEI